MYCLGFKSYALGPGTTNNRHYHAYCRPLRKYTNLSSRWNDPTILIHGLPGLAAWRRRRLCIQPPCEKNKNSKYDSTRRCERMWSSDSSGKVGSVGCRAYSRSREACGCDRPCLQMAPDLMAAIWPESGRDTKETRGSGTSCSDISFQREHGPLKNPIAAMEPQRVKT